MRSLLLCLVSLGLGFTVGFLVRGPGATAPRPDPAKPVVEGPAGKPRAATSDLARALEAIPTAERPQGDGRITGRVVDLDGEPLSGVRISLQRAVGDVFGTVFRVAAAPDLETAVRQYVDWWRDQTTPFGETTSGEDGRFVFEGLADHGYYVTGELEGHEIGLRDSMFTPEVRPGGSVALVAHPLVDVHLDVVLPEGTRPERASVLFSSREAGSSQAEWLPADPVRRTVPGRYTVSAFVGETDATYLESRELQITVKAHGSPPAVVLRVLPGIYGTVEFASEGWHAPVKVHTLRFEGDEPPSGTLLAHARRRGLCTRGSYSVSGLEPGRYAVGVTTGNDLLLVRKVVQLGPRPVSLDFHVKDLDPAAFLRLTVRDPKGRLLRNVHVRVEYLRRAWGNVGLLQADGSYLVPFPTGSSPGNRLYVEVKSEEYGTKTAEWERGDTGELEISFGATASLTVELSGTRTATGFWVGLRRPRAIAGRGVQASSHEPSGPGRFLVQPLGLGDYELLVFSRLPVIVARKVVTLAAGENRARISLPALSVVTIRGLEPGESILIYPDPEIRWKVLAKTADGDGKVVLDGLPPARYVLKSKEGSMAVRVEGSMDVPFEPTVR